VVDAAARHIAITNTRTGLVATLAALGAGVGLAYTARTYRLSREGHLTDRYTKAVEQLGSDKIEMRLGGIYALERLMRDSSTDQPTIMEVLTAHIRQHAPRTSDEAKTTDSQRPGGRLRHPPTPPSSPDADVQAVLTVLGRRTVVAAENPIWYRSGLPWSIDLTDTHLAGVQLQRATLLNVCFDRATLIKAGLVQADLTGAGLGKANLTNAYLVGAILTGACLVKADLTGAQVTRGALTEKQLAEASNVETIKWREVGDFVAEPS